MQKLRSPLPCIGLPRATSLFFPFEALVAEQERVEPVRNPDVVSPPSAPVALHPANRAHVAADALERRTLQALGQTSVTETTLGTWQCGFEVDNLDVLCWDLAVRFEVAD